MCQKKNLMGQAWLKSSSFPICMPNPRCSPDARAKNNNKYLLSGIDYVGGLEFDYVVIIGVDDQRVPPKFSQKSKYFHFSNYAWHRRMYVALTRARYGVFMIGDKSYGKSDMFVNAIMNKFVDFKD